MYGLSEKCSLKKRHLSQYLNAQKQPEWIPRKSIPDRRNN